MDRASKAATAAAHASRPTMTGNVLQTVERIGSVLCSLFDRSGQIVAVFSGGPPVALVAGFVCPCKLHAVSDQAGQQSSCWQAESCEPGSGGVRFDGAWATHDEHRPTNIREGSMSSSTGARRASRNISPAWHFPLVWQQPGPSSGVGAGLAVSCRRNAPRPGCHRRSCRSDV
jgi:hypothetical protein